MKKLAIIGASYLQLPLVLKANELGIETYCFAYEKGAICKNHCTSFYPISITEKEKILEICTEIRVDAILTIASDLSVPTVNFIADKLKLIANPITSSIITTNKYLMKEILSKNGLKVAKYFFGKNLNDTSSITKMNFPLIIKPADRSGSAGVTKINNVKEYFNAFDRALNASLNKEVIIEEFIDGYEISVETITLQGKHYILAITDKVTTGTPNFVELEHHQPSLADENIIKQIIQTVPRALNALNIINGASHSEFIIQKEGGIYLNEVGARMGGDFIGSHLVELSTGYDFLKGTIEVAFGIFNIPKVKRENYSGVLFYNPKNRIRFFELLEHENIIVESSAPEIERKQLTQSGDRHGYLIYQSDKKVNFE